MTDWLWWDRMRVKEMIQGWTWGFLSVQHWQHRAQRHQLAVGALMEKQIWARGWRNSTSQFWNWWFELRLVGSWKYRCGASEKGWCWKYIIRSYHNRNFSWSQEGRCAHPGRKWSKGWRANSSCESGRRPGMSRQRKRWHPHWGLCIRLLITFVYKPSRAIINADELSSLHHHRFCCALDTGNYKAFLKIQKQKAAFVEFESQFMNKALKLV